jgi:hypothetical protein
MSPDEAQNVANELFELRSKDRRRIEKIRDYLNNEARLTWLPLGTPRELQALAQMSRVNMMPLAVKATTQQMFVDGYTSVDPDADDLIWNVWQLNRWDRKQIGVHKSAASYGVGYGIVMPGGDGVPALRSASPRTMTTAYGQDTDWPRYALEDRGNGTWRLYDDTDTYDFERAAAKNKRGGAGNANFTFIAGSAASHEQDVTPVVRYVSEEDIDDPVLGDVEPLFTLQDQVNLITFHLLVAEHYGAHGRKIIIGRMVKELEARLVKASANTMMTVNAEPGDVQFEELSQTALGDFLTSRQEALRMMAATGQIPAHELLGSLANLAAATLVESRESTGRKVAERQVICGEAHEQLLGQAGTLMGLDVDPMARIRWKPTIDQRAVQLVDLLATISEKLGVPQQALWDQLPFSATDIESFRQQADQTAPAAPTPAPPATEDATETVELPETE